MRGKYIENTVRASILWPHKQIGGVAVGEGGRI